MTQVKNEPKMAKKGQKPAPSLRDLFLKLSEKDKNAVTHFFNLHNAAIFVFTTLSKEGVAYAEYCMKLSQEKKQVEKEQ